MMESLKQLEHSWMQLEHSWGPLLQPRPADLRLRRAGEGDGTHTTHHCWSPESSNSPPGLGMSSQLISIILLTA